MDTKEKIQKQIEIERKRLETAIEDEQEQSVVFKQSHKLDDLIIKYYNMD